MGFSTFFFFCNIERSRRTEAPCFRVDKELLDMVLGVQKRKRGCVGGL